MTETTQSKPQTNEVIDRILIASTLSQENEKLKAEIKDLTKLLNENQAKLNDALKELDKVGQELNQKRQDISEWIRGAKF